MRAVAPGTAYRIMRKVQCVNPECQCFIAFEDTTGSRVAGKGAYTHFAVMCPSCWNRTQVTTAYYDFLLEANPKAAAALKEHVATFEGIPAAPMNPGMNRFQQELEFYTVKKECDCGGSIERGRTVTCDHSLPRKDAVAHCPSKSLRHMCFTCEARFCDKCFTNYHENP